MEPKRLADILAEYAAIMLDVDAADGELTDDIAARLVECEEELGEKVERIEAFAEAMRGKAVAVRERVKRLEAHARALENRAASAHTWAVGQLEAAGLTRYETDSYSLAQRANPPRLEVRDEAAIMEYAETYHADWVRVVKALDKKAVLDAAKANGGDLPGVAVVRGTHWRVS
jgi:phage host-nuclease inhibitor protein Gam